MLELPKSANEWADYWYHEIGGNVIPAISIDKIPIVKWLEVSGLEGGYQKNPIPEDTFNEWKNDNKFKDGMAVICGQVWRGPYKGQWLNMIDMDNKKAIEKFCLGDIRKVSVVTLIEQHKNPDKAHVYYYTERPVKSKVSNVSTLGNAINKNEVPAIEVKSNGNLLSYCTPSPHKDGSSYQILTHRLPQQVEAEFLELTIEGVCSEYKIPYLETEGNSNLPPISDIIKEDFFVYKGNNRHVEVLRYMDSKLAKNPELTDNDLLNLADSWMLKHCDVPIPREEVRKLLPQVRKYVSKLPQTKEELLKEKKTNITIEENEDVLGELMGLLSKTIKGDENYIYRLLFNGLSCFTDSPSHLIVMERTSEGKTYPALEIAQHFPKESIMILGSATPQTFKYEYGILVNKDYEPIQDKLDVLVKAIDVAKQNKQTTSDLEVKKRELLKYSKTLIELQHKWIIFKEPPNHKLLEALYSTLSSDEEYSEHKFVNKTNAGKQQNFTVVLHGTPAMLICTAKDETKNERWSETASRFEITSPISSPEKYKGGINIIGSKFGLPGSIYKKHVISDEDKRQIKQAILKLITLVRQTKGELFNPFIDELNNLFPQEVGTRWRQYKRFMILTNLHCFCYGHKRPKIETEGNWYPVVIKADIEWANDLMEDNQVLAPNKLRWFSEIFLPVFKEKDCQPIRVIDLVEFVTKKGGKTSPRQLRQVYLEPLFENGFIEKGEDKDHASYKHYWTDYKTEFALKSPIPVDSLDSCDSPRLRSCLTKYLGRNFRSVLKNTPLTEDQLISAILSTKNSCDPPLFEPKKGQEYQESTGIQRNVGELTRDPLLEPKKFFICETCNPPAGPFEKNEESKSSGNILEFHEKLGHKIMWMDESK